MVIYGDNKHIFHSYANFTSRFKLKFNPIFVITLTNHNRVVYPQGNFTVLDIMYWIHLS